MLKISLLLFRLSQAHAKLMFRKIVLPMDAIIAVSLMDLSMQDCLFSGSSNVIQTTFHEYPDFIYLKTAKTYLTHFGLHNIWESELLFYAQLLQTDKQTLSHNIENDNFELFKCVNSTITNNEIDDVIESTYFKKETNHILQNEFFHRDKHSNNELIIKHENISHNSEKSFDELFNDEIEQELLDTTKENDFLNENSKRKKGNNKSKVRFQLDKSDDEIENEKNHKKRKACFSPKKTTRKCDKGEIDGTGKNQKENEIDNLQILNCLPSVNDIYKELNISFDFCDDDSSIETSTQSVANDVRVLKENPQQSDKDIVKSSAFKKLQNFSFTSRKNNCENQKQTELSILENKRSTQNNHNDAENVTDCMNSTTNQIINVISQNKVTEIVINTLPSTTNTSHTSIFESDENLDGLDF